MLEVAKRLIGPLGALVGQWLRLGLLRLVL